MLQTPDLFDEKQTVTVVSKTMCIAFDGGTPCNIPRLGFGNGYGSYQIDGRDIVRLEFGVPMSNNAAEISTLVEAVKEARLLGATSLVITGDSMIALNCADRLAGNLRERRKKKSGGSHVFHESIQNLRAALAGISVRTEWKAREHSVRRFGH